VSGGHRAGAGRLCSTSGVALRHFVHSQFMRFGDRSLPIREEGDIEARRLGGGVHPSHRRKSGPARRGSCGKNFFLQQSAVGRLRLTALTDGFDPDHIPYGKLPPAKREWLVLNGYPDQGMAVKAPSVRGCWSEGLAGESQADCTGS